MDEHSDQRMPPDLLESVRALISVNQEIAQSLANLQRLYADELVKRDEERKKAAAEREELKRESKQAAEKYDKQIKENLSTSMRQLPWPLQVFWGLLIVVLILLALNLGWHLMVAING